MGRAFIDKFSLLHFATGIVAQFWGSALWQFVLGHVAFELLENTPTGMAVINMLPFWPGGKDKADTWLNIAGDNFFAVLGFLLASFVNT